MDIALRLHALTHIPHPVHCCLNTKRLFSLSPSGFAHHLHRNGHPDRNTIVLIPGPSWRECLSMLNTFPTAATYIT